MIHITLQYSCCWCKPSRFHTVVKLVFLKMQYNKTVIFIKVFSLDMAKSCMWLCLVFSLYTSIKFTFNVLWILSLYGIHWVPCKAAFAFFINEVFNSINMHRINNVKNMNNNQFFTKYAAYGSWLNTCISFIYVFLQAIRLGGKMSKHGVMFGH